VVDRTTPSQDAAYERIRATDEFASLKKQYLGFVVPMTIAFMVWYLLFVVCSNWAPGFMNIQVIGNINIALIFGLLQFVTTFLIAFLYSRFSTANLDPTADKLRAEYDKEIR